MASGYTRNFDARFNEQTGKFDEDHSERAKPRFWFDEVYDKKTDTIRKVEMIEIHMPGEDKSIWGGKVTDQHRQRFARHYEAFRAGAQAPVIGHALDKLPGMTPRLLTQLQFIGFTSIEDLARATDQAIAQFLGGMTWRKKAQLWLDEQKKLEGAVQSSAEKDAIIAQQGEMLKALQEQMAQITAQMQKKPGRKAKTEQVAA